MDTTINGNDIQAMVGHWLGTPAGAYLGSDYGQTANDMLQLPQSGGAPDAFLAKMSEDVPVLQALPSGSVNLYGVNTPPDRLDLIVEIAGMAIQVPTGA